MKPTEILLILAALGVFVVTEEHNRPDSQEWSMRRSAEAGKARLSLDVRKTSGLNRNHWQHTTTVDWSAIRGITAEELDKLVHSVKFDVLRDAGILHCEGRTDIRGASCTFTFEPSRTLGGKLRELGYSSPDDDQLFSMMMHDVSLEFARKAAEAGLRASTEELIRMRSHGVSDDYIDQTLASGYPDITARDLIAFRDHGVATEFLRDLKESGYNLPAREVVEMRDHGVSSDFIAAAGSAGYKDISGREIRDLHDRGVDGGYLRRLRDYGLAPRPRELVQMRDHGVDPEFLRDLKEAGYGALPTEDVIRLRDHGVSSKFARAVRDQGFRFSTREIVEMQDHGVDEAYLRKLKESGFGHLSAEKIIKLRDHGVE